MQHLELSRDIAERMNTKYGGNKWKKLGGRGGRIFKVPDAFIAPVGARVMSLTVSHPPTFHALYGIKHTVFTWDVLCMPACTSHTMSHGSLQYLTLQPTPGYTAASTKLRQVLTPYTSASHHSHLIAPPA